MSSSLVNKALLAVTFCFWTVIAHAAPQLLLSPQIRLDVPPPAQVVHQDGRLIYAYDEWMFSHEQLGSQGFYPGIDLAGMQREYVMALFDPGGRASLPRWLAALAEEQAASLGISAATSTRMMRGTLEVLAVFDPAESRGDVFILAGDQVHRLSFKGSKEDFTALIAVIKER